MRAHLGLGLAPLSPAAGRRRRRCNAASFPPLPPTQPACAPTCRRVLRQTAAASEGLLPSCSRAMSTQVRALCPTCRRSLRLAGAGDRVLAGSSCDLPQHLHQPQLPAHRIRCEACHMAAAGVCGDRGAASCSAARAALNGSPSLPLCSPTTPPCLWTRTPRSSCRGSPAGTEPSIQSRWVDLEGEEVGARAASRGAPVGAASLAGSGAPSAAGQQPRGHTVCYARSCCRCGSCSVQSPSFALLCVHPSPTLACAPPAPPCPTLPPSPAGHPVRHAGGGRGEPQEGRVHPPGPPRVCLG